MEMILSQFLIHLFLKDNKNFDLKGRRGERFKRREEHFKVATKQAARSEVLLTEESG